MENKLRECFEDMVVYKDLKKSNFFSSLGLPSFLRDWVLKKFEDDEGNPRDEKKLLFFRSLYTTISSKHSRSLFSMTKFLLQQVFLTLTFALNDKCQFFSNDIVAGIYLY